MHWERSGDKLLGYLFPRGALQHVVEIHQPDEPRVDLLFIYGPANRGPHRCSLRQAQLFAERYVAAHFDRVYGQLSTPHQTPVAQLCDPSPRPGSIDVSKIRMPPYKPRRRRR